MASCILLVCSRKLGPAVVCVRVKKWEEAPPRNPAGADVKPLALKLSRDGTTPRLPWDTRAWRSVASSMPCSNLPVPRPKLSALTLVMPARTRGLLKARLKLENRRSWKPSWKWSWNPKPRLKTAMLTTLKRLNPTPHQGKKGSNGPQGNQPIVPKPKPKPTWGPKPMKVTNAGDHTGR